jgi:hypothetical protein
MGPALAAVTDDADLPGLDQIDVGITVVIDAHEQPLAMKEPPEIRRGE